MDDTEKDAALQREGDEALRRITHLAEQSKPDVGEHRRGISRMLGILWRDRNGPSERRTKKWMHEVLDERDTRKKAARYEAMVCWTKRAAWSTVTGIGGLVLAYFQGWIG